MPILKIEINDVTHSVLDEGDGEAILLLHGFPDGAATWRHQIPALVEAGYRVVAPDLRGFGASGRPARVEDYKVETVLSDLIGILDHLEIQKCHVMGHDWGAFVAWLFAAFHPIRTGTLAVLQVGHPNSFFRSGINQRRLSWYISLFQFVGVAEDALQRDDWKLFRDWLEGHPDTEQFIADLARPGALTAGLNWYRANIPPSVLFGEPPSFPNIKAPSLGIWGDQDMALCEDQVTRSADYVDGGWTYERIRGASHWVQIDRADDVNRILLAFVGRHRT